MVTFFSKKVTSKIKVKGNFKMIKIAIDGPSGSGKSTLAKALAKEMNFIYVDTGALYRTVGLFMLRLGVDPKNSDEVTKRLKDLSVALCHDENGVQHVLLNGEDVGDSIRTPDVASAASDVSAIPAVRAFLLNTQRDISKEHNVIMDGRDIGTVIFPDAQVKIFLTADNRARAERRYKEMLEKGKTVTLESILESMAVRDQNDRTRKEAPAIPADDAVMLDNSGLDLQGTLDAAKKIISERLK